MAQEVTQPRYEKSLLQMVCVKSFRCSSSADSLSHVHFLQRAAADMVLAKLLDEPNAWRMVDTVLESTKNSKTLFFALQVGRLCCWVPSTRQTAAHTVCYVFRLQILENAVKFRWGALPADQRKGIRDYVVKKVIGVSHSSAAPGRSVVSQHCH